MIDQSLSTAEFDELDAFLMAEGRPRAIMDIAMLDGFVTALLTGPNTILPSRWLPEVWGETADEPMVFDSTAQSERMVDLVMRLYGARALDLREGADLYDPVVYTREEDGKTVSVIDEWCTGFMRGVQMDPTGWDPLFQSEEDAALMMPMILYGTETGVEQLNQNESLRARHQNLADALGICVIGIRDYWLPQRKAGATVRRTEPKVGRNDPCPCGSGKKFKKCCGGPDRLH
ncbi:MAG: UPF0149 family protein [Thiobacillus sp.]|nr:UPF0149 family protein [Thiobacillus sp.]